ncbi:MAG: hypothetical protein HW416_826, partial [Chloroflexi bacterium]|nr:hypothetical protein [Chloroflexota bacterium]
EAREGDSVLLLNEIGAMDPALVTLMEEAARQAGAEVHSLWGESIPAAQTSFSKVLIAAMRAADKVVMSYAINREHLHPYLKDLQTVRVNNRCRTPELFATEHTRLHWGMVRAIYAHIEETFASGTTWRVSSPAGTDVSGRVGKASEVADAYFAGEAAAQRYYRVFPGETYSPAGSLDAVGKIVSDHPGNNASMTDDLTTLVVEGNQVVAIQGGAVADQIKRTLDGHREKYGAGAYVVDSFHGGMHPKAINDPKGIGAISTTERLHFHNRTLAGHYGAGVSFQTVEVDGRAVYENGKLAILDDPEIRAAAASFGLEDGPG